MRLTRGKLRRPGDARRSRSAHARRPALRGAGRQLRRAVAVPAQPRAPRSRPAGLFPDFDDNLRQAFRRETELFFESIMREDRSVLDLLTRRLHLPQRAAREALRHSRTSTAATSGACSFDGDSARGGLLGQGSILTVTSYADRTSPVMRGKWMLENLLGAPPPPPPPNVPALKENATASEPLSDARAHGGASRQPGLRGCHS